MRGTILAIASDGTYGQLGTEDGQRYSYWTNEVRNGRVQIGQAVDFQMQDGQPIDIYIVQRTAPPEFPAAPRQAMPPQRGVPMAAGMGAGFAGQGPAAARNYWVQLFISPSGRISRRQFWLHGFLPIMGVNIFLSWIPLIGQLLALAASWGTICISFKRFHDCGYPGWYSLLAFIPLVLAGILGGVSFFLTGFDFVWLLAEILSGLFVIIVIVQFVMVYIRIGQEGPNQYGPDPLAVG